MPKKKKKTTTTAIDFYYYYFSIQKPSDLAITKQRYRVRIIVLSFHIYSSNNLTEFARVWLNYCRDTVCDIKRFSKPHRRILTFTSDFFGNILLVRRFLDKRTIVTRKKKIIKKTIHSYTVRFKSVLIL